jgi:hypothetical protein
MVSFPVPSRTQFVSRISHIVNEPIDCHCTYQNRTQFSTLSWYLSSTGMAFGTDGNRIYRLKTLHGVICESDVLWPLTQTPLSKLRLNVNRHLKGTWNGEPLVYWGSHSLQRLTSISEKSRLFINERDYETWLHYYAIALAADRGTLCLRQTARHVQNMEEMQYSCFNIRI